MKGINNNKNCLIEIPYYPLALHQQKWKVRVGTSYALFAIFDLPKSAVTVKIKLRLH